MKFLKAFGMFWYDFIIGDDWKIAVAVVAALGITGSGDGGGALRWWLADAVDDPGRRAGPGLLRHQPVHRRPSPIHRNQVAVLRHKATAANGM